MKHAHRTALGCALAALLTTTAAQAGRPLVTDDASTNPQAQCQFETWVDLGADSLHGHLAPACGVGGGWELGLEAVYAAPANAQVQARAASLKWAPEWLAWGELRFGLRGGMLSQKEPHDPRWRAANWSLIGIVSWPIDAQWTVHLNAGHQHDIDTQAGVNPVSVAVHWQPHPRWSAFMEAVADTRSTPAQSVGMRWWLLPETLGLDLTASRSNATDRSSVFGIGLGWYGLRF